MASTVSDVERTFESFDWSNPKWKAYLDNLYPSPPLSRIEHYKRKWFKNNINEALTLETVQQTESQRPSQQNRGCPSTASFGSQRSPTVLFFTSSLLLFIGVLLSFTYMLPLMPIQILRSALAFQVLGFLSYVIWRYGGLLIATATMFLHSWLSLVSPTLTSIVLLGETSSQWLMRIPNTFLLYQPLTQLTRKINSNRYTLMQYQSHAEIALAFILVSFLFMRLTTMMTVLLYFNALRFKYQSSPFTKASIKKINQKTLALLSRPGVPHIALSAYEKICSCFNHIAFCATP